MRYGWLKPRFRMGGGCGGVVHDEVWLSWSYVE